MTAPALPAPVRWLNYRRWVQPAIGQHMGRDNLVTLR